MAIDFRLDASILSNNKNIHQETNTCGGRKDKYYAEDFTFMVSTGCINEQDSAQDRPPANAAFSTLLAGNSTGGSTATTVEASNQILLHVLGNQITTACVDPQPPHMRSIL